MKCRKHIIVLNCKECGTQPNLHEMNENFRLPFQYLYQCPSCGKNQNNQSYWFEHIEDAAEYWNGLNK